MYNKANPGRKKQTIMKTIFRFLAVVLVCLFLNPFSGWSMTEETVTKTSLKKQRFEMIQSGQNCSFSLLLDKYTGNTWLFYSEGDQSGWKEIFRQEERLGKPFIYRMTDKGVTQNRYQIKVIDGEQTECFLIDTVDNIIYELVYDRQNGYAFVLKVIESE